MRFNKNQLNLIFTYSGILNHFDINQSEQSNPSSECFDHTE